MATPNILKIQSDVARAGIPVTGKPTVVVRKIKNTNSPSQHSFGNAIDYYPTNPKEREDARRGIKVESLERLYAYLKGHSLARVVCYYDRGGCTTNHRDHVHVDAHPKIKSQSHLQQVLAEGAGEGSGVDYVGMSASALRSLDCGQFKRDGDLIIGLKPQFSEAQREALIARANECGSNNPWVPDFIEGPVDSATGAVDGLTDAVGAVGGFLELVGSGEFVKRAAYVVGGVGLGAAGLYFIGKEFGLPSVTETAKVAASAATKGAV